MVGVRRVQSVVREKTSVSSKIDEPLSSKTTRGIFYDIRPP